MALGTHCYSYVQLLFMWRASERYFVTYFLFRQRGRIATEDTISKTYKLSRHDPVPVCLHFYPLKWTASFLGLSMWRRKQKQCVVAGCKAHSASLHTLPNEPVIKDEWLKFIYDTIPEKCSRSLTVCSTHFTPDCFLNRVQFNQGFAQKLLLKEGAIPTLHGVSIHTHCVVVKSDYLRSGTSFRK